MEDMHSSTFLAPIPTAADTGTYFNVQISAHKFPRFRSMLGLALTAIRTSPQEALYMAYLVACWASIFNIDYHYYLYDSYAIALHKVIFVIREHGIRFYIFLANTDSGEIDVEFLKYAPHCQTNASSGWYLYGALIFVGQVDIITHVLKLLHQKEIVTLIAKEENYTTASRQGYLQGYLQGSSA
jgi:hypothetical protein